MREQTDYFFPVSNQNNEIKVLDYSFADGDFKGLVGSIFVPITKKEMKERTAKKNVIDFLDDCYEHKTKKELEGMYKELKSSDELIPFMFDLSYQNVWGKLRELGYNEKEYPIFECIGGGRCFKVGEKFNLKPELEYLLNEFEGQNEKV